MDRIPNQIVSLGGHKYAIPQENLKELARIPAAEVKDRIDKVGSLPVIKLRQENDQRTNPSSAVSIAIVSAEAYRYGLVVERFLDSEELDILPLGRYLSGCGVYMGTTILKDESAALVLDILGIASLDGLSQIAEKLEISISDSVLDEDPNLENYSLLVFSKL